MLRISAYGTTPRVLSSGNVRARPRRSLTTRNDRVEHDEHDQRQPQGAAVVGELLAPAERQREDQDRERQEELRDGPAGVDHVAGVAPHRAAVAGRQVALVAGPERGHLRVPLLALLGAHRGGRLLARLGRRHRPATASLDLPPLGCRAPLATVLGLHRRRGRPLGGGGLAASEHGRQRTCARCPADPGVSGSPPVRPGGNSRGRDGRRQGEVVRPRVGPRGPTGLRDEGGTRLS